jgi:glucose-1-phosphate thymidylyltransferase
VARGHVFSLVLTKIVQTTAPIYDKPMICYPLATLMLADCEVLIISTPKDLPMLQDYLATAATRYSHDTPSRRSRRIAQAFLIGAKFIGNSAHPHPWR